MPTESPSASILAKVLSPAVRRGPLPQNQLDVPAFSAKLEKSLAEVLPSEDPLDVADFDPISYLNASFPDEDALSEGKLDSFLKQCRGRTIALSEGISRDVRDHSLQRRKTEKAVQEANVAIHELFEKIASIKEKAARSELMVQEICRDIKSLDYAVKHLTNTIRALRNLHMLVSACDQLKVMSAHKQYRDAANLFRAIADLFTLFESYGDVPKICTLKEAIEQSKSAITDAIVAEFHRELSDPISPDQTISQALYRQLNSACSIIDVVEPSVKKNLVSWFSKQRLDPYDKLFRPSSEAGTLEGVERRYGWMRRTLREYESTYANIFPESWDVPAIVARDFCSLSSRHISDIIEKTKGKLDVNILIRALQKTNEFERELNLRFRNTSSDSIDSFYKDSTDQDARAHAAKSISIKHRKRKADEKSGGSHASPISFEGRISDAFMPCMSVYVELERNNLRDLVRKLELEEQWLPTRPKHGEPASTPEADIKPLQHLAGADSLFLYIKNSLRRGCNLARGQTLFNLFKEYQTGLLLYCTLLGSQLPVASTDESKAAVEESPQGFIPREELLGGLLIVNTCQYVQETLPSLQQGIQDAVDDVFKEHVDLTAVGQEFADLLNRAVKALVAAIAVGLNRGPLAQMLKMPWGTWEAVGDQSDYVNVIHSRLKSDVLATAIIPAYISAIFKCKRVSDIGGHQLALDAHALKSILLSVPDFGKSENVGAAPAKARGPFRAFIRYVNREMGKAEALLKTLVSEPDRMACTYASLLPKTHADDLTRLMALRGFKKTEQIAFIEAYNATAPHEGRLEVQTRDQGGEFNPLRWKIPGNFPSAISGRKGESTDTQPRVKKKQPVALQRSTQEG
eukprot:g6217.t1